MKMEGLRSSETSVYKGLYGDILEDGNIQNFASSATRTTLICSRTLYDVIITILILSSERQTMLQLLQQRLVYRGSTFGTERVPQT
jgi:hypothetical protein